MMIQTIAIALIFVVQVQKHDIETIPRPDFSGTETLRLVGDYKGTFKIPLGLRRHKGSNYFVAPDGESVSIWVLYMSKKFTVRFDQYERALVYSEFDTVTVDNHNHFTVKRVEDTSSYRVRDVHAGPWFGSGSGHSNSFFFELYNGKPLKLLILSKGKKPGTDLYLAEKLMPYIAHSLTLEGRRQTRRRN
jgi:hypothetical protein